MGRLADVGASPAAGPASSPTVQAAPMTTRPPTLSSPTVQAAPMTTRPPTLSSPTVQAAPMTTR